MILWLLLQYGRVSFLMLDKMVICFACFVFSSTFPLCLPVSLYIFCIIIITIFWSINHFLFFSFYFLPYFLSSLSWPSQPQQNRERQYIKPAINLRYACASYYSVSGSYRLPSLMNNSNYWNKIRVSVNIRRNLDVGSIPCWLYLSGIVTSLHRVLKLWR